MPARKDNGTTPPPKAVAQSLRSGTPVDLDALRDWYQNDAPAWCREKAVPMDLAVFIYRFPAPTKWEHFGVIIRKEDG